MARSFIGIQLIVAICFFGAQRLSAQPPSDADETLPGVPTSVIAVDPQDSRIVYAGTSTGIFKSTDGGTSWTRPGVASPAYTTDLVVDPQNSDTIWAVTYNEYDDGVFKSLDGGITWTKLLNVVGAWTIAVDPRNTNSVVVGTAGIVKSVDGGASWHYTSNYIINVSAFDPHNPDTVYAGGNGTFLKSTDRGEHWNAPIPTWPFGHINALAVDPKTPGTIYAGTQRTGVIKSTDAGSSWVSVTSDLGEITVTDLVIDPNETNTLYGSWVNSVGGGFTVGLLGLLKTTDAGSTWKNVSKLNAVLVHALAVDPRNAGTLYVGTDSNVWKTSDGGSSWSANSRLPILFLGIYPNPSCVGYTWYLRVHNALPNSPVQLSGTSNGEAWAIPDWRTTSPNGAFAEGGIFAAGTQGSHTLRVDVGGVSSNTLSFVVSACRR